MKTETLSKVLGIIAIINFFMIVGITTALININRHYLIFNISYAGLHLIYQYIKKEGIFS